MNCVGCLEGPFKRARGWGVKNLTRASQRLEGVQEVGTLETEVSSINIVDRRRSKISFKRFPPSWELL